MNWKILTKELKELSNKISYTPDIIVGITRGGLIPARILSTNLNVKDMFCISVKKFNEERKVLTQILDNINNKNVLLVEDMLETGKSLIVAKKYLESKGAIVKTCCLYTMDISEITPDFYLNKINKVESFPWE